MGSTEPEPGTVLEMSYEESLLAIEKDFAVGASAARAAALQGACEATPPLRQYLQEVLDRGGKGKDFKDWRCVMNKRIGISYQTRPASLVWLDDKVEQVSAAARLLGRQLHLPLDTGEAEAVLQAARRQIALDEPFVVKPRHGSNSKHVAMWRRPAEAREEEVLASIRRALEAEDQSWRKESWNQNAVPKGVVLQPLYAPMADLEQAAEAEAAPAAPAAGAEAARRKLLKPLELKVQVLFGEVVGGCLNTHPMYLWVLRSGALIRWRPEECSGLLKRNHGLWEELPAPVLQRLQEVLQEHWRQLREDSELLARRAGLDELRVDWLLGDPRWGCRIGELTYMGTMALDLPPISRRLARAFAEGHLSR
ncbi:unnamed protein product [Effrenium voratum]|uniref:Uncharacterized protein n=1 Tax=Effrenium voratum TaxID=2562239 RepID=A0AA36IHS9_9DINO|nr:unnamed protein product [Effrenium voratum]